MRFVVFLRLIGFCALCAPTRILGHGELRQLYEWSESSRNGHVDAAGSQVIERRRAHQLLPVLQDPVQVSRSFESVPV
jgi:hypothetical protein